MEAPAIVVTGPQELGRLVGAELPPTPWMFVSTGQVALFDDATFDGPSTNYGGAARASAVHGTHSFSLLVPLWERTVGVRGFRRVALYGVNRVRFPAPLPVGSRVRGRFHVTEVTPADGGTTYKVAAAIERERESKPACVGELVFRGFA